VNIDSVSNGDWVPGVIYSFALFAIFWRNVAPFVIVSIRALHDTDFCCPQYPA
jgi:hypothetical protein